MKAIKPLRLSGREVLPLVEGGKGINVSSGLCSGAWAAAGGVATFSGVNAESYDENGQPIPQIYRAKSRHDRQKELIVYGIKGGIDQARIAHETARGQGRIHMNLLWEMGGAEAVLEGILEGAKGLIHGVTCGAGMPYRVAEIAAKHGIYYYPIVSSARALRALWMRSFRKHPDLLGGVVYEDPWLAGGHNGLSNNEDPLKPEKPYNRLVALREQMREFGLFDTPIIMAGGVWWLSEWQDYMDNHEIGPIAFQFGTRPLLTQESPISDAWKKKLLTLKPGDVVLNRFSPTGFYSSAVRNNFLRDLEERSARQIPYAAEAEGDKNVPFKSTPTAAPFYVTKVDYDKAQAWIEAGHVKALRTPDDTLVFVTEEKAKQIQEVQAACMGCLSACTFSSWSQGETGSTGRRPDPRSFCIQNALQSIMRTGDPENYLMFAGHNAYRFASDPFYANGFIPTVKQLIDRIMEGK